MLTLQALKDMEPHKIFATGLTIDNPSGVNMSNSDRVLRWVARRGGTYDWAIYIGPQEDSISDVASKGDKVHGKDNIKRLVDCDDKALAMYRR